MGHAYLAVLFHSYKIQWGMSFFGCEFIDTPYNGILLIPLGIHSSNIEWNMIFRLGIGISNTQWHMVFFDWEFTATPYSGHWFSLVGNSQPQHAVKHVSLLGNLQLQHAMEQDCLRLGVHLCSICLMLFGWISTAKRFSEAGFFGWEFKATSYNGSWFLWVWAHSSSIHWKLFWGGGARTS